MAIRLGQNGEMAIVLKVKDDGSVVVEKFANTAEKSADRSSTAWGKAGLAFGALAASAATTAALMVKSALDTANATSNTAEKLGMTTEALSALNYHARLADVGAQDLGQSLQMMTRNLSDAARGSGTATDALRDIGLNAQALAQMSPDRAIIEISEAMEKIPNQGDRVALAMEIFGRSGADMVQVLAGGKKSFEETRAEAERLGIIISSDFARQQAAFERNLKRSKAAIDGLAISLAQELMPALSQGAQAMAGFFGQSEAGRTFVNGLGTGLKGVAHAAIGLSAALADIGNLIGAVSAATVAAVSFNFTEATRIMQLYAADSARINKEMLDSQAKLWETPADLGAPTDMRGESALNRLSEETKKKREELGKQLKDMHDAAISEQQALAEKFVKNNQLLQEGLAVRLLTEEQFNTDRIGLAEQYEQKQAEIYQRERGQYLEQLASQVTALQDSLLIESELLQQKYLDNELLLFESWEREILTDQQYQQIKQQLAAAHEKNLTKIADDELKKRYGINQVYRQLDLNSAQFFFGQMAALMLTKSKTLFEIGKTAAIAETVIQTYRAAQGAYAALAHIPVYGPALGIAAAAAAIASGMARVDAIRNQQLGGATGAVGVYAASANTGLPTSNTITGPVGANGFGGSLATTPAQPAAPRPIVNITLNGSNFSYDDTVKLIETINEALGNGAEINVR